MGPSKALRAFSAPTTQTLEVIKIMRKFLILLLASYSLSPVAEQMCDTSKDPVNADVEEAPLNDADYSEQSVLTAMKHLGRFFTSNTNEKYYIPDNHLIIINGGYLLRMAKIYKIKWEAELAKKSNDSYWKEAYIDAKEEYCKYRTTHFLIDW